MSDEQETREAHLTATTELTTAQRKVIEDHVLVLLACRDPQLLERMIGGTLEIVPRHIVRTLLTHIEALMSGELDLPATREAIAMGADLVLTLHHLNRDPTAGDESSPGAAPTF